MTADVDSLVAFLRQQLDKDEQVAREAADNDSGRWFVGDKWNVYRAEDCTPHEDHETNELVVYGNIEVQSAHIARWDPSRVLAEVAAKREILRRFESAAEWADTCRAEGRPEAEAHARHAGSLLEVIGILAQPYAGRPGWRDEWAVVG